MPESDLLLAPDTRDEGGIGDLSGVTARTAVASGRVVLGAAGLALVREGQSAKGDILAHARVAGAMAAKQASLLIPSCQGVLLSGVDLDFEIIAADEAIEIRAYVKTVGPAGVGMEALTAVSVAALTIVDMCKGATRDASITDVHLVAKSGGQSGSYRRPA